MAEGVCLAPLSRVSVQSFHLKAQIQFYFQTPNISNEHGLGHVHWSKRK
jgi:hypothetical protein